MESGQMVDNRGNQIILGKKKGGEARPFVCNANPRYKFPRIINSVRRFI
jgi:hypothetical protein